MSEPLKIFLSHSSSDQEIVTQLYSDLQKAGFAPWMDSEDVLPGEDWRKASEEALKNSDVFIFCLSESVESFNRDPAKEKELYFALEALALHPERTVLVIPALLSLPSNADVSHYIPTPLQSFRFIDFDFNYDKGLEELIIGLQKFSDRLRVNSSKIVRNSRNFLISEIELSNIRCFEKLTIDLKENDKPIQWAMILGDNAVGKTTLLRSIALGLCNVSDATALMRSIAGGFVRQGKDLGYIKIQLSEVDLFESSTSSPIDIQRRRFHRALLHAFPTRTKLVTLCFELDVKYNLVEVADPTNNIENIVSNLIQWAEDQDRLDELIEIARRQEPNNLSLREFDQQQQTTTYTITTTITKQSEETEIVRQTIEPDTDFLWTDIFVCGYGANRTTQTYANYEDYRSLDAVQSLFTAKANFQNPEVILLRSDPKVREQLENRLLNILMLDAPEHKIIYTNRGIELDGPWGRQPLQVLSDGYRSTTQWVLDFLGWLIQANRLIDNPDIGGILIIDEIEQHLHPRWQRYIVQRLRKMFPKTQIFASTHTPLVASGIADMESGILLKLDQNEDGNVDIQTIDKQLLDGKRADQVLASEAFGLPTSRNPGSKDYIDRYTELLSLSSRTEAEEVELQSLRSHFQDAFQEGESEAAQLVGKAVSAKLQEAVQDISPELLDLEIKRQLQQLSRPEAS